MTTVMSPSQDLLKAYLYLRRAIGMIGLALPPALILGKWWLDGPGLLNSISGYYYTSTRDWFVGGMCAVGVFLLFYGKHRSFDDWLGNVAGVAAIGVAFFPTSPSGGPNVSTGDDEPLATTHVAFAAAFFLCLAVFCLVSFTRHDQEPGSAKKPQRNNVYVVCGIAILACLAAIVVIGLWFDDETRSLRPILWLESLAVWSFAFAWLTKGRLLPGLRD